MKLYDANAGNSKRVRIFIDEKGVDIPREVLELGKDTRSPEYRKINPLGEVPALELDDGQIITEAYAISLGPPENCEHTNRWAETVRERPSWSA